MGWTQDEFPSHEGYLVGIVPLVRDGRWVLQWHELGRDDEAEARRRNGIPLDFVQVACDCGWRSSYLRAPRDAQWALPDVHSAHRIQCTAMSVRRSPFSVVVPEWFEVEARILWFEHIELERARARWLQSNLVFVIGGEL